MIPDLLRGGLRIAVLVLVAGLAMLPFQPGGSAEFYVSLLAAIIGAIYVLAIVLVMRLLTRGPPVPISHRDNRQGKVLTERAVGGERPGSGEKKGRTL